MGRIASYHKPDERYLTLRIVGVICTGIGAVLLVVGAGLLAFGLYCLLAAMTDNVVPVINGVGGLIAALWSLEFLVSGLLFLAMGALFRLAIHVEENTRASAQCLERIRSRLEPGEENVGPFFRS